MATYTDRITLVFPINDPKKQRPAAASLQMLEISETGNEFEKLIPIDPVKVKDYAGQFNLPLLANVTELEADLATASSQLEAANATIEQLKAEKQELLGELSDIRQAYATEKDTVKQLQAKIASLEANIVELTPPPKPASVTPAQIRLWLISNGISLDTVAQMIAAIPHEATREAASVRWEYGLVVLRDDPLVQQMGAALGFTTEQMDAAFLHASQID